MHNASKRHRLPPTRTSVTHHAVVPAGEVTHEYYVTVSFFEEVDNGAVPEPAEFFVRIAKDGSEVAGWVNAWATTVSIALQYGVPWNVLKSKYLWHRFGEGTKDCPSLLHAITSSVDKVVTSKQNEWTADHRPQELGGGVA